MRFLSHGDFENYIFAKLFTLEDESKDDSEDDTDDSCGTMIIMMMIIICG